MQPAIHVKVGGIKDALSPIAAPEVLDNFVSGITALIPVEGIGGAAIANFSTETAKACFSVFKKIAQAKPSEGRDPEISIDLTDVQGQMAKLGTVTFKEGMGISGTIVTSVSASHCGKINSQGFDPSNRIQSPLRDAFPIPYVTSATPLVIEIKNLPLIYLQTQAGQIATILHNKING